MICTYRLALRGWLALAIAAGSAGAGTPLEHPWNDRSLPAGERAELALCGMTDEEKLSLVHGVIAAPWGGEGKPIGSVGSAGYVAGVPRLGIPALQETDAELGVANPGNIRRGDTATAMPSDLALASTWDLALARRQGEAVGAEARAEGFNVLLGGAANLIRDPRGGRDFEYFSEDPLLTGLMAGAVIDGVQSGPSSRPSSTSPSMRKKPTGLCSTRGSTRRRRASPICSPLRSPSSAGVRAA